jgi:HlyD family secretion protein
MDAAAIRPGAALLMRAPSLMRQMTMTPTKTAIAAALALSLGLAACAKKPVLKPTDEANARAARVGLVEARPMAGGLSTSGVLVAREEAAVSTQLSGYAVTRVLVEPPAQVSKGQPLATLDDTLLRSQIAQQTAMVAQQQVAAEQADQQAKDVAGLDHQGVLSTEQIDQRRFQARSSHAALAAQQAQLKDLQTREALMTIRAPVAGLVLARNVRPGDIAVASSATPMFRMARDSLVELQAQIAEGEMAGIRVGDAVQVTLPDGTSIQGHVRLIDPSVDALTKLGTVRVSLPVRPDLRPGGFGRAVFTGLSRSASTVPETAIRYDADGASVMMLGQGNRVSQVPVRTGDHAGGYVELVQGPPTGSKVLLGAAAFVLPGDVVRPVYTEAPTLAPDVR